MTRLSAIVLTAAGSMIWLAQAGWAGANDAWHPYADCAAGYRANWQDRLSDPGRSPAMRDMIRSQAEEYEAAAVRRYRQATGEDETRAREAVQAYVQSNLERFVTMDQQDALIDFLDRCPQPDDPRRQ